MAWWPARLYNYRGNTDICKLKKSLVTYNFSVVSGQFSYSNGETDTGQMKFKEAKSLLVNQSSSSYIGGQSDTS